MSSNTDYIFKVTFLARQSPRMRSYKWKQRDHMSSQNLCSSTYPGHRMLCTGLPLSLWAKNFRPRRSPIAEPKKC